MAFDPISAALDIGGKLIDRLWPNPAEANAAKMQLFQLQQTGELAKLTADTDLAKAQLAVEAAEAATGNMFLGGGRPFFIWICGFCFAEQYFLGPLLTWGSTLWGHPVAFPTLDMNVMMAPLLGLLGLGGMHAYENVAGMKIGAAK